jgi:D-amino-acid dehydrogenase
MKVVVLGAGVVGVTSAWYLATAGHEVLVVDRQPEPALETSFANGGQISVSHCEPWANPEAPAQILRWLGKRDAPLLFRPRADLSQWLWGLRFMLECLPNRTRRNTAWLLNLALYSREQLHQLRHETGIRYDLQTRGILHLYERQSEFERAKKQIADFKVRGLDMQAKTPEEVIAIEPALRYATARWAGGVYAESDESGDAHQFTRNLADLCRARGVVFRFNVNVKRLEVSGGDITRVVIDDEAGIEESLRSEAYVVALGSYSPLVLNTIGMPVPVFPVKGYSVTLPLGARDVAPQTSLTDHCRKIVISRLGDRLRVAGTAELAGYDTELNMDRCSALLERCFEWFPRLGHREGVQFWTGLRPSTPNNLPVIGQTKYSRLFVNTGHGTLGWTLACGSGRVLTDIVGGRKPEPDFPFAGERPKLKGAISTVAPI